MNPPILSTRLDTRRVSRHEIGKNMKKLLIGAFIILGIFSFYTVSRSLQNNVTGVNTSSTVRKNTVQQKIGSGDYTTYQIEEGKSALDLLQQTSTIETKGEKENAYVVEIEGRKADDAKKEFWSLYINGTISPVGAGSYILKNNDNIEWKIETY